MKRRLKKQSMKLNNEDLEYCQRIVDSFQMQHIIMQKPIDEKEMVDWIMGGTSRMGSTIY